MQSLLRQLHQRGACALWPHVPLQLLRRCGASAAACAASCAATCLMQTRAPGLPPPQTSSLSRSSSPFHSRWLSLTMPFTQDAFHSRCISLTMPPPAPQTKSRAVPSAAPTYRSACAPSCRERQRALHACHAMKDVHCVLCVCAVKDVCGMRRRTCIVCCI